MSAYQADSGSGYDGSEETIGGEESNTNYTYIPSYPDDYDEYEEEEYPETKQGFDPLGCPIAALAGPSVRASSSMVLSFNVGELFIVMSDLNSLSRKSVERD